MIPSCVFQFAKLTASDEILSRIVSLQSTLLCLKSDRDLLSGKSGHFLRADLPFQRIMEPDSLLVSNKWYTQYLRMRRRRLLLNAAGLISTGTIVSDISMTDSNGQTVRLSDFRGRQRVVLVFYPGDNTPVCTAQLCAFRDDWSRFEAQQTTVFGVNPANEARHKQFAAKHKFPFPLLVDIGGKMAQAFGCRGLFGMIKRTVYAIDKQGRVVYARRGNPQPSEILAVLQNVQDAA